MLRTNRSDRSRRFRPALAALEDRALLSTAMHHLHAPHPSGQVHVESHSDHSSKHGMPAPTVTVLGQVSAGGYTFTNFDGPTPGTNAGAGTNLNGISNAGTAVGFTIDNNGGFHNFTVNPLRSRQVRALNINGSTTAMAFGTNRARRGGGHRRQRARLHPQQPRRAEDLHAPRQHVRDGLRDQRPGHDRRPGTSSVTRPPGSSGSTGRPSSPSTPLPVRTS